MNRINLYLFSQIVNSCTLVFFIFVSIAWLLQLSRLFTVMNNLQINTLDILLLSILIIPNLMNVILPFILTFGFALAFIKFDKDKEIIAIYSLGLTLKEIKKPIYLIILCFILLSLLLNFFFSPFTYNIYKEKEFNLRNSIEFNKINISNFIKFNDQLTIDFENDNGKYKNILIDFKDEYENILYSEYGLIEQKNNKVIFKLNKGFKIKIKDEQIENLKFDKYIIDFPTKIIKSYNKFDQNTLNLFELIKNRTNRNNIIINHKLIDTLILMSICFYFYINIIKKNNYNFTNSILFIIFSILALTIDHLLENFTFEKNNYIFLSFFNILTIHLFALIINFLKLNE